MYDDQSCCPRYESNKDITAAQESAPSASPPATNKAAEHRTSSLKNLLVD